MPGLIERNVSCPCCGESITVLVDHSPADQSYVEDCQVCCRPIVVDVALDDAGGIAVQVRAESD